MALLERLLAHLRSTWPMATVVAELVTVQDGKFVVRALVQVAGTPVASGMAAATTIEVAEDQAKERAIQALGISVSSLVGAESLRSPTFSEPAAIASPATPPHLPTPIPSLSPPPSLEFPALEATPTDTAVPVVADWYNHVVDQNSPADLEAPLDPQQVLSQMVPASSLLHPNGDQDSSTATPKKPRRKDSRADASKESEGLPMPDSIDLSDIIAQTDIEMRRLNWSNAQGREYLQHTYNKRTRSELNDPELYEFLSYLKTQPSPEVFLEP